MLKNKRASFRIAPKEKEFDVTTLHPNTPNKYNQADDAEPTSGSGENTPIRFLKREGMSIESSEANRHAGSGKKFEDPDYISGRRNDPHKGRNDKLPSHYRDHGYGNHREETEKYEYDE